MIPSANAAQLALFGAEALVVAFLLVVLLRVRRWFGYAPLYVVVGSFQFVQVVLSIGVYVPIGDALAVSPGSAVMLPATVFAVLMVYLADDAAEARRLIYAVVIANVTLGALSPLFAGHGSMTGASEASPVFELFRSQPRILLWGTLTLFFDVVLVITVYEALSRRVGSFFVRVLLSGWIVLWFDTLVFVTGAFLGTADLGPLIVSGLVGKSAASVLYAGALTAYAYRWGLASEKEDRAEWVFNDVFRPLSYRQRFEEARFLALNDALTGLRNRRYFEERLAAELEHLRRGQGTLALLLVDIDHFKSVNDLHGHSEGDRALRFVADCIRRAAREGDVPCRVGGEEFAVLAVGANVEQAAALAARIRERLTTAYADNDPPFPMDALTVTVGIAAAVDEATGDVLSSEDLLRAADRRLYAGKAAGRDRVVTSG